MKIYLSLIVFLLLNISCTNSNDGSPELETRSFYMGFTAFPYDYTKEAQQNTYQNVVSDSDIFLNHLDHGVPWDEALNNLPFPKEVQNTLNATKTGLELGTKILLTATPASQTRKNLALYWNNNGSHQPLPQSWKNKTFDDPDVVKAYLNYCKRIIDEVQPDYFAYGIETNASFKKNDAAFDQFLKLSDTVYNALKTDYPDLPIFLTLQDQSFENSKTELLEISKMLLQYSDYIAMSSYPFLYYQNLTRDADPNLFSDNWLSQFRGLDTSKPFAIAETGFCAENLAIENLGVTVKGTEAWQADFMDKLFNHANNLDAKFIAWFIYQDYDKLYEKTSNPPDILKVWKDCGLLDGNGEKRPSYTIWQKWKSHEKMGKNP